MASKVERKDLFLSPRSPSARATTMFAPYGGIDFLVCEAANRRNCAFLSVNTFSVFFPFVISKPRFLLFQHHCRTQLTCSLFGEGDPHLGFVILDLFAAHVHDDPLDRSGEAEGRLVLRADR